MQELNHTFFSALRLAKIFFDSDVPDKAKNDIGIWELDEDSCYALGLEASEWIFQNTAHYYNERKDVDTWLFADPIIDRFCRLCQEYERDKGITEEKNRTEVLLNKPSVKTSVLTATVMVMTGVCPSRSAGASASFCSQAKNFTAMRLFRKDFWKFATPFCRSTRSWKRN